MNHLLKILYKKVLVVAVLLSGIVYGQDLPKVIHPAPSSSALFRFIDYPMDYSTGLPQISLPIYEVKSGSLSVPISISNHASGRRVTDQNGPIALGWSLQAGGMISRTVYGSPDFGTNGSNHPFPSPFNINNINIKNDLAYLQRITHFDNDPDLSPMGTWMDSEYDVFSYSFNGHSGKFIFKDSNNIKIPAFLPYKPFKLTTHLGGGLSGIDIIDDAGIQYIFIGNESYTANEQSVYSGFNISKMISADKSDTISFIYTGFHEERTTINQQTVLNDLNNVTSPDNPFGLNEVENKESTSRDTYHTSRLTEIDFKQGKVLFNLSNGTYQLENIQIKNLSNQTIKTIQFNRSYLESLSEMSYSLDKLDSLTFKDESGASIENYSFTYYPTIFTGSSTQIDVRHRDWWGYYNASGEHDMVPYTSVEYQYKPSTQNNQNYRIGNPNYRREPDLNALKSGMLKKITYPTGGSSEFVYEKNKYFTYATNEVKVGPGLRIAQIKSDDNNGNNYYKTYKYGISESGYGTIDMEPQLNTMATQNYYNFVPTFESPLVGDYRQRIFYSGFIPELSALADRPVIYSEVAEYNGTETNNLGKTIYNYDYYAWAPASMPSYVYGAITKMHIYDFNYWNNPSLILKTDYKRIENTGSVSYQKQRELVNNYAVKTTAFVKGLHVQKVHIYTQSGRSIGGFGKYPEEEGVKSNNVQVYSFNEYRIPAGYKNLMSSNETLYSDDGRSIISSVAYEYNQHQLMSKTIKAASDRAILTTQVRYPFDLTEDPVYGAASKEMVSRNMLNVTIEQSDYKNSLHIKSVKTKYKDWGNNIIAPEYVELNTLNNASEVMLRYIAYDNQANICSVSKENDVVQSYIWGYNKTLPVAQITGADYNTIGRLVNQGILNNPQSTEQQIRNELNNIRTGLSGTKAMVTTFTFKPLIGMTSQTDPNGKTTYYMYDSYGRLSYIKDHEGNVLKKYCYNYQGKAESCNLYFSKDYSGNYNSKNCSLGSFQPYYVSVPEGQFSSTASQTAADLLAQQYAQQQANQYGTCLTSYLTINYYNRTDANGYTIRLYNTSTGASYNFSVNAYSNGVGQIPVGTYNISIRNDNDNNYRSYSAGCSYYNSGYGNAIFYNVPLSGTCNRIEIY
jgi:YD repeat-containing protein